ncbi:MAG: thioredoxin [Kiritimatiellae bacterium]|nr:thioredoxin [Kiritimatiellia bacterium]
MAVRDIKEAEFNDLVKTGKVIVDFWATWCGPCKMQGALIEQKIVPEHPEIEVLKVNVDEEPGLAARFGVMSIPTLLLYKDGALVEQIVGLTKPDEILAKLA